MRVIEPHQLYTLKKSRAVKSRNRVLRTALYCLLIILILVGSLGFYAYMSPVPKVAATTVTVTSKGSSVDIPWPDYGQSAVGAVGYGVLATSASKSAVPTASVAKVMTALAVLKEKPLKIDETGPTITLTTADEALYNEYVAKQGSVVPVDAGEQITERQALEAMLLPSSNNMADSLAIWAFGSVQKYAEYANEYARQLGLNNTVITSASGFPPDTVSTASDLVKLGIAAMNNPVVASIVVEQNAKIPVAGQIHNVNFFLGKNNIVGVKTGNTDQAGGVYLFASKRTVDNQNITLVGAVMGAKTLAQAMNDSLGILNISFQNFTARRLVNKGDKLGYYNLPWGGNAVATAAANIDVVGWKSSDMHGQVELKPVTIGDKTGLSVGKVKVGEKSTAITLNSDVPPPSQSWRLFRWF